MMDGIEMDNMLKNILENVYGKITYYDPDRFLQGVNFQLVDGENLPNNKNLGDPGGYCLAWSLWFIDVVVSYPNEDVNWLMRNYFSRENISQIISQEEEDTQIKSSNYYLDFIRRYAHMLNREKNKVLMQLGVKQYNIYNMNFKPEVKNFIIDLFKIK